MGADVLIGREAIERHAAEAVWADDDLRAEWSCGLLDVPPRTDAFLRQFERRALRSEKGDLPAATLLRGDDEPR